MSIFKTTTTKDYSKPAQVKNLKNHIIKNRSLFGQSKTIIRNIKNLFKQEVDYYKPSEQNIQYFEYKSNGDRNKTFSIKVGKIKRYLKEIINNLKKLNTSKTQIQFLQTTLTKSV